MALNNADIQNFQTLLRAAQADMLALMQCTDAHTGAPCAVVCAVNMLPDGNYEFVPLSRMFDDNPYEMVLPPNDNEVNE